MHVELGSDENSSDVTGRQIGFLMRSRDESEVISSRINGFSYTAFAPYSDWEQFSGKAWGFWEAYRRIAKPVRATRLGVRFVNQIDIPKSHIEIKDYMRTAVDVSPYLPQLVAGYFMQITVPLEKFGSATTITSTVLPPSADNQTSLILDIDAFQFVDIEITDSVAADEIRSRLNTLRDVKNYTFEACITDATRGLIS
ncbi:hypothetical protein GCM10010468_35630 [Actinocorallia longicatena]|uniref:TIGR04255 family protein n=2 Tax=Actinocorallia longicatena TaxID=111803 RepID=A0ABP6QAN1_9ACTN